MIISKLSILFFDLVKQNRDISESFIKELHQLVTRHQKFTEAVDQFDNTWQMKLLKGQYKIQSNNPKRQDGSLHKYCPSLQTESEMQRLVKIYHEKTDEDISPIILSAWFHHAFTQIHPFQDGNGRIARLLASIILIKNGLFPLTIQIIEYAKKHNYFFNRNKPRGWFQLLVIIDEENRYDLIITIHHFGYNEDSTIAIGAFIEFVDTSLDEKEKSHTERVDIRSIPIAPYTISLDADIQKMSKNIKSYIVDVSKVGLAIIFNDIA